MIIQNALVYTPRHTFEKGSIVIREGRIVPFAAPEEGEEVLDAQGLYACRASWISTSTVLWARISVTARKKPSRRWRI